MDVIVTLGNEMRGDDAAGIMFGRLLEGLEGVEVIEGREAPENVTGLIEHHRPKRILFLADYGNYLHEYIESSSNSCESALKSVYVYLIPV